MFGIVGEVIKEVAGIGLEALWGGKSAKPHSYEVHVQKGHLRPGGECWCQMKI